MKTFEINGVVYTGKELTFNAMCFFEDHGVSFDDIDTKRLKFTREYLAFCGNISPDKAGNEIEQHLIKGGDLDGLFESLNESVETSGFFRAMAGIEPEEQTVEEPTPKKSTAAKRKA